MKELPIAFVPELIRVPLDKLRPSRRLPASVPGSTKYRQIVSSIREEGLVEPLSVTRGGVGSDEFIVLDGHVRLMALMELGYEVAPCLVATDDETYTYNSRINRLSTIQESRMLREAVSKGVSRERLAQALNIDPSQLSKRLRLLDGICPEAAELLKDREFSSELSRHLRKMKATRQVECIELMLAANSLTVNYCEALLVATPVEMLVGETKPAEIKGVTPEQMARMEREMTNLQSQQKLIEDSYAEDVLNLMLAQTYLAKLLANEAVLRFVRQESPEICEQLELIVAMTSLDQ